MMKIEKVKNEMLTTNEVVNLLGISRSTLYRARKSGKLRATRLGRFLRFERKEIENYIQNQKEQAVAA